MKSFLKRLETAFLEAEKKLIALKKWCVRVTLASKDFITRLYNPKKLTRKITLQKKKVLHSMKCSSEMLQNLYFM